MHISEKAWPVSTHIHGLEVRPSFDGNPVSWFTNNGTVGVGYMDLKNKCYFDKFLKASRNKKAYESHLYKF